MAYFIQGWGEGKPMHWPAESAALFARMLRAAGEPAFGIAASSISIVLFLALLALASRHRRLKRKFAAQASARSAATSVAAEFATPVDRVLFRSHFLFYFLTLALSISCWFLGLALAPSVRRFQASLEWHVQPLYLAAHLIALRLFVRLFLHNYVAGAAQLDMPIERITGGIRSILGLRGGALAGAIAVPFCLLDYHYLVSDRYEKLSEDQTLHAIDYVMWGIWCAEWLVNAFIWVALAGFLALSYRALRTYRFRFPMAKVVQEKLYRPFLQMSSQGATIVLVFAGITGFYIWYAGGALSDFLGLGVTGLVLVLGFIPLWLLLNAKVRCAVAEEIEVLRLHSPAALSFEKIPGAGTPMPARTVEERLDELLALMHAWRLEHLQLDLGRTEAKALAVRLAMPAATAGWQLYSNLQGILSNFGQAMRSLLSMIAKLLT
jgi:hypothetical protein